MRLGLALDLEIIGNGTALNPRQLRLSSLLGGLDIRLCHAPFSQVSPFFNEGPEALLEGVLPSVQSARVLAGAGDTVGSFASAGTDCYGEFRQMIKTPSGFFNFDGASSSPGSRPRVSKMPSIKE
jgi:hypothetical protein